MKFSTHAHSGGDRLLSPLLQKEIAAAISAIALKPAPRQATAMRDAFLLNIKSAGWSSEVTVSRESDMTITSLKSDVGLCLQTGNMARIYADLMKLQTMYLDNSIKGAFIVLPSLPVAKLLGSNIAQADRLVRELPILRKAFHVPSLIFALE